MRDLTSADGYFNLIGLRRLVCLAGLVALAVLASVPAVAQGEWQLYGGTSFLWAKTTPQQQNGLSTINEFGWQTDISQYPWHWFGGTLESSGFYGRPGIYDPSNGQTYSNLLNTKAYTLMFGPTFAYTGNKTVQPFGHVLLGGIDGQYAWTSKGASFLGTTTQNHGEWVFGWALGGGADIRINDLIAIRGQADWIPTSFYNFYDDRQNNIRLTVGVVFRFGGGITKTAQMHSPESPTDTSSDLRAPNNSTQGSQSAVALRSVPSPASANTPGKAAQPVVVANNSSSIAVSEQDSPVAPASSNSRPAIADKTEVARAGAGEAAAPAPPVVSPATQAVTIAAQPGEAAATTLEPGGAINHGTPNSSPAAEPVVQPAAMVEFWSSPAGADVLIDGHYVGSTYSTIAVQPGQHTIIIRKENYAPWQREILITSGEVRVAAYLEQVKATVTFH